MHSPRIDESLKAYEYFPVFNVLLFACPTDGLSDCTPAARACEAARFAYWQITGVALPVWFPPGITYCFAQRDATLAAIWYTPGGAVNARGAVIKATPVAHYNTHNNGGGGGLGVWNVAADDMEINADIDCNNLAAYGVALMMFSAGRGVGIKGQGTRVNGTIRNIDETLGNGWLGVSFSLSAAAAVGATPYVTVTGTYHKNVSGTVRRPNCPVLNPTTDLVTGHAEVSAVLLGGDATNTGATGMALVSSSSQWNINIQKPDRKGVLLFPRGKASNLDLGDMLVHDLGTNQVENYAHDNFGRTVSDAAINVGTNQLNSAAAAFAAGDVNKLITVEGAGRSGGLLVATVLSVAAGVATLSVNASTTVAGAVCWITPLNWTLNARQYPAYIGKNSGTLLLSHYILNDNSVIPANVQFDPGLIAGDGEGRILGRMSVPYVSLNYGANIPIDAKKSNCFRTLVTSAAACTYGVPANPVDGQEMEVAHKNTTAGAVAIPAFAGGAGGFALQGGAARAPAAGKTCSFIFKYVAADDVWNEVTRSAADY